MKYRVWDKKEKQFIENVFVMPNGRLLMFTNYHSFNSEWDFVDDEDRYIISECSGYQDKYGKYIYNGDVVSYIYYGKTNGYEVVYDEKEWYFCNRLEKVLISDVFKKRIEIKGNIYELSGLIEV